MEKHTHTQYMRKHVHTHTQTHRTMKNEKGREKYELKSNALPGLLLLLGNFHANGKIENVNKILFLTPEGRFYLYPQIPVYSVRAVN